MKYEFTGKTKTEYGVTVRQIRALITITGVVSSGDVGGWIESEKNLSQVYGDAWVYGDAHVSGNAQVYGNALVFGNARVFGDAWVYGDACVYGDAHVSGNAQVYGNALVFGDAHVSGNAQVFGDDSIFWASKVGKENGTITVFNNKYGMLTVTRGCFIGSDKEFIENSKRVHNEKIHREYCLLIEVAKSRIVCNAEQVTEVTK